jgi:SAM-dependent methyltransferase
MSRMPPVPDSFARPAERAVVNDYDSFAEEYSAGNEASLINGYYTRPAILDLAGDVAGRRILDAGCGSGPLSAALRDRGATVTGFDSSAKMLELARQRLGPGADLHLADLGSPLPFPDGAFDDVIACLVLHYLQDWTAPLAELRRVLRPGGRLIVAIDHPYAVDLQQRDRARARLFRDLQLDRTVALQHPHRPDELLDAAAARDDRRVHRGRLPDSRHQRATPRTRRPRTVPRPPRRHALGGLPVLPALRPASRLTAAARPS